MPLYKKIFFIIQSYIRRSLYVYTSETTYPQIWLPSFPWTLLLFPSLGSHMFDSINSRIHSDLPETDSATLQSPAVASVPHQRHSYSSLSFFFLCAFADAPAGFPLSTAVVVLRSLLIYKWLCFFQRCHSAPDRAVHNFRSLVKIRTFFFNFSQPPTPFKGAPSRANITLPRSMNAVVRISLALWRLECFVLLEASHTEGSCNVAYRNAQIPSWLKAEALRGTPLNAAFRHKEKLFQMLCLFLPGSLWPCFKCFTIWFAKAFRHLCHLIMDTSKAFQGLSETADTQLRRKICFIGFHFAC